MSVCNGWLFAVQLYDLKNGSDFNDNVNVIGKISRSMFQDFNYVENLENKFLYVFKFLYI